MSKILFIISGANGSGKTTFAKEFCKVNKFKFINTDEIAKKYNNQIKAGKIFLKTVKEKLNQDNSFVIETTLSGRYIKSLINEAKSKGFKIKLIHIFLDNVKENILRVKHRVLNGGHNVSEKDIVRRYFRSKKLFLEIKDHVDSWSLIFNGEGNFILASKDNRIYLEDLYEKFLEDLNEL